MYVSSYINEPPLNSHSSRPRTTPEVVPGFSPEVRACADYADTLGHLTSSGAVAAAQTIGDYYAAIDTNCCPQPLLSSPAVQNKP